MIQDIHRTPVCNAGICEQCVQAAILVPHLLIGSGLLIVVGNVALDEVGFACAGAVQFGHECFAGGFLYVQANHSPSFADEVARHTFTYAGLYVTEPIVLGQFNRVPYMD